MNFEENLLALLERHCEWLEGYVTEIRSIADAGLIDGHRPDPSLSRALDLVHQIKGTSGSLGFAAVSQAAADFEFHLKGVLDRELEGSELTRAFELLAHLETLAVAAEPERSTLYLAAAS